MRSTSGAALLLGKGEDASGGRDKPSILSDALEARHRSGVPRRRVGVCSGARAAVDACADRRGRDRPRAITTTRLACRSWSRSRFDQLPRYQVRHEGPDHVEAVLRHGAGWRARSQGTGEGRSKKQAEQVAAARRLGRLPRVGYGRGVRRYGGPRVLVGDTECRSCPRSRSCAATSSGRSWARRSRGSRPTACARFAVTATASSSRAASRARRSPVSNGGASTSCAASTMATCSSSTSACRVSCCEPRGRARRPQSTRT